MELAASDSTAKEAAVLDRFGQLLLAWQEGQKEDAGGVAEGREVAQKLRQARLVPEALGGLGEQGVIQELHREVRDQLKEEDEEDHPLE